MAGKTQVNVKVDASKITAAFEKFAKSLITSAVLGEIAAERRAQDEKWGEQNHPNGTGPDTLPLGATDSNAALLAIFYRNVCNNRAAKGTLTFADILAEEFFEALAEDDPAKLREELVQVAAVAAAWVEKIDRDVAREANDG